MRKFILPIILFVISVSTSAQEIDTTQVLIEDEKIGIDQIDDDLLDLNLMLPEGKAWRVVSEGQKLEFKVAAVGGKDQNYHYSISGDDKGITIDSVGLVSWTPGFEVVERLEKDKQFPVVIEVTNDSNQVARQTIDVVVKHVNRPPVVGDLKNMYVKYNEDNTYQIDLNAVNDPDNDPLVFRAIPQIMPEGANLTENGVFTWKPSFRQFNRLKNDPIELGFIVEDQPYKDQAKGNFNILITQMDLPPEITMIPKYDHISTKENETVNLKFFLSDPNGDEDIKEFNLVSEDLRVKSENLVKNAKTQYEFIWQPGYDFVKEIEDSLTFDLNFYVVDGTYLRDERQIRVTVIDTENQEKIDAGLYAQYRTALIRVWDLYSQLSEKEDEYYKKLKKARKGKTTLAITDASLGAVTALSPVVIENQNNQKLVSGIGGTTVMTMGTLEAADVIAKSPSEIIQKLNRVIEKKNELLMHGNVFARRYSTTLNRRDKDFIKDTENLLARLIIKDVATLELNAGWQNKKRPKDENLRSVFPDFVPMED